MKLHTDVVPTQSIYRQLLQAMAHPCRPYEVDAGEWPSLRMAVAETLLDHEVSFALHESAPSDWDAEIFQATKALQSSWEHADYLFVSGSDTGGDLLRAKRGEFLFPDKGATLVYVMEELPPAVAVKISGPGLQKEAPPGVNPFSLEEWKGFKENTDTYPLGVDAICLVGNSQLIALPRSTQISWD